MRVLELFSGIGGLAAAVDGRHAVVGAVDHDRPAQAVYGATWPHHRQEVKNLVSVKPAWLAAFGADLWWMSPPCAPHGIRGRQEDLDDPRSSAFRHLVGLLPDVGPAHLALENVPWFHGSRAWELLVETLGRAGYGHLHHAEICPTERGIPARRRRFYAVASRHPLDVRPGPRHDRRLADHLDPWDDALAVPAKVRDRFGDALHVVDAEDDHAVAATFTRAYGTSPVYAGSYLRQRGPAGTGLRYFSPTEIARLHGFPPSLALGRIPRKAAWKRVGNSVSVEVVREVVGWIAHPGEPPPHGDHGGSPRPHTPPGAPR